MRLSMAVAATLADVMSRALSFTGAQRLLGVFADHLRQTAGKRICLVMGIVLANIAVLKLPHRTERIEPRAKKRQSKPLPLLTVPRHLAREEIRARRVLKLVPRDSGAFGLRRLWINAVNRSISGSSTGS